MSRSRRGAWRSVDVDRWESPASSDERVPPPMRCSVDPRATPISGELTAKAPGNCVRTHGNRVLSGLQGRTFDATGCTTRSGCDLHARVGRVCPGALLGCGLRYGAGAAGSCRRCAGADTAPCVTGTTPRAADSSTASRTTCARALDSCRRLHDNTTPSPGSLRTDRGHPGKRSWCPR